MKKRHHHYLNANNGLERQNPHFKRLPALIILWICPICIMTTITEHTVLKTILKRHQNVMERKKRKSAASKKTARIPSSE